MTAPCELSATTCAGYLQKRREASPVTVRELGGGVSNTVLLIEQGDQRFVLKQSLERLRVADEWRADRSRIFRERDALRDAAGFLPAGAIPEVLWSDEPNFVFAMSAANSAAESWKSQLLDGRLDPAVAARVGVLLGRWIRHTWKHADFAVRYGDQRPFDQLRIDPYYRTVARRRPEVAAAVRELVAESAGRRVSLVHGDWSPKNFLIHQGRVMVIDFEVVHYGDPSFDAAFCLNHLLLKCFHRPSLASGLLELARVFFTWTEAVLPPPALHWFEGATTRHLGFLMLARVDGKSPVEYITSEPLKESVRRTATRIISGRPDNLEACYALVAAEVERL